MSTRRLTAAEVVAEVEAIRSPYIAGMELADLEGRTDDYDLCELVAEKLTKCAWLVRHNLIETPEQSRERFERWRLNQGATDRDLVRTQRDGRYASYGTEILWGAWQASQSFHSEQET